MYTYIYIHTLHCIALHYITLPYITLPYITLHYIHICIYTQTEMGTNTSINENITKIKQPTLRYEAKEVDKLAVGLQVWQ